MLFFLKPIYLFLKKEVKEEFKRPTNAFGVLLYLSCSTFIISLITKGNVNSGIWSAFFWILMLFASFNVVQKHLHPEEQNQWNYYYLLIHPIQFILARTLFHALFLWILSLLNFILLSLWIKNPINSYDVFFVNILLGALGLATTLTMISSIAVQSNHPTMIMSVLGFPIIIPLLWCLIKINLLSIQGLNFSEVTQYFIFLISVNCISLLLSMIFFPIIWKE